MAYLMGVPRPCFLVFSGHLFPCFFRRPPSRTLIARHANESNCWFVLAGTDRWAILAASSKLSTDFGGSIGAAAFEANSMGKEPEALVSLGTWEDQRRNHTPPIFLTKKQDGLPLYRCGHETTEPSTSLQFFFNQIPSTIF